MRDSLLSWLLPSASFNKLKHKAKKFAALHKNSNSHTFIGETPIAFGRPSSIKTPGNLLGSLARGFDRTQSINALRLHQ